MRKKKPPFILLALVSILAAHSGQALAAKAKPAAGDAEKPITLLYSGDLNGNIRPVNE